MAALSRAPAQPPFLYLIARQLLGRYKNPFAADAQNAKV